MKNPIIPRGLSLHLGVTFLAALLAVAACTPAAQPSPTAAPAKPAPTTAPAKPASQPAATAAPAKPAAQPTAGLATEVDTRAIAEFFKGKTVRIVTGFTPGGLFDGWSRLLAKHMPKHVPGSPTMIVENMAGAGSLTAANYLYNVAPKDGTVIGNFIQSMLLNQIRALDGIQFDMAKYEWLGAMQAATIGCVAREETGVHSLADALAPSSKQVIMGTSAPGSTGYDYPVIMQKVLGANLKLVTGYAGNAEVRLAIERGEVDGYCVAWEVLKPTLEPWKEAGQPKVSIIVQASPDGQAHPELPGVPTIEQFVKNDDDRQLIRLLMAPEQFYWPFALPPGTPAERVRALRQAMQATLQDPEFRAEADKANWTYNGVTAEKINQVIKDVLGTPAPIQQRFKEILESDES